MNNTGSVSEQWDVVAYEVAMLRGTLKRVDPNLPTIPDRVTANALVESACLHMRILTDILLSTDHRKRGDIQLAELIPNQPKPLKAAVAALHTAYHKSLGKASSQTLLNKMMAHPDKRRRVTFDYTDVFNTMKPAIEEVLKHIEQEIQPALTRRYSRWAST